MKRPTFRAEVFRLNSNALICQSPAISPTSTSSSSPDRIIQCVDYLQIGCNRVIARARLDAYYLFIGVLYVNRSIQVKSIPAG